MAAHVSFSREIERKRGERKKERGRERGKEKDFRSIIGACRQTATVLRVTAVDSLSAFAKSK